MTIGAKRERVQFKRKVRVKRDDGGYDVTLSDLGTYWADVQPVDKPELESVQSGHLTGPVLYYIYVDAKAITPTVDDVCLWVTKGNMQLNVRAVRNSSVRIMDNQVTAEFGVVDNG